MQMGEGYDPDRFFDRVLHGFKCCICQCVLNEPRLCQAEEHKFCLNCISQHLPNSQTCPVCQQPLTLETLKCPAKEFKNVLSELRIKCEYNNRGCPEHVELGNLQNHVNNCEYRPVTCEECHLEVNAKDEDNHKKSFCQLGGANIQGLKDIKLRQEEMKEDFTIIRARQKEFDDKQKELEETQDAYGQKVDDIDRDLDEMEGNQRRQKRKLEEIIDNCEQIFTKLNKIEDYQNLQRQELSEVTNSCEEIQTFTNTVQDEMRSEVTGINAQVKEIKKRVKESDPYRNEARIMFLEMAERNERFKTSQDKLKTQMREMEGRLNSIEVMKGRIERFEELLLNHLPQENINTSLVHNDSAQAIDPTISANKQDVIIIGGFYNDEDTRPLDTVEIYSIAEKKSIMLPRLNNHRSKTASFVHNNNVLVAGGLGVKGAIDTIEALNVKQCPLRWTMFDGNLPAKLKSHAALVYQDKLISIGGFNDEKKKESDAIYETALIPPHTSKLLTRMKEPRFEHKAEIVNGKVFILGGSTTESYADGTDSVVVYDLVENKFKPCPSLPQPVCYMSTVTWGDKIIVLGGVDKYGQILDDVIIYETETGQSSRLPSMINKRQGSCAVIMNDVIVVFGGFNREQGCLNSVESFTIGGDGWKELPRMIEKRCNATAVVKPHI